MHSSGILCSWSRVLGNLTPHLHYKQVQKSSGMLINDIDQTRKQLSADIIQITSNLHLGHDPHSNECPDLISAFPDGLRARSLQTGKAEWHPRVLRNKVNQFWCHRKLLLPRQGSISMLSMLKDVKTFDTRTLLDSKSPNYPYNWPPMGGDL